ncbi:MAG: T9SS type A sorting domain-containing protein [Aureispira sp.]|nr:T9SS type A sorting domain-containing protein [Aureispira sp.]
MKTLLLTISTFLFLTTMGNAQITFENAYDNVGGYTTTKRFTVVHLENSGEKYMVYDYSTFTITLYNTNHSIFKTIAAGPAVTSLFNLTTYINQEVSSLLHVKENLFDTDAEVEVMIAAAYCNASYSDCENATVIVNENGSTLFSKKGGSPLGNNITGEFASVYNVNGTDAKMALVENDSVTIYDLPGTLQCSPCGGITGVRSSASTGVGKPRMKNYPNPAKNYTIINYELPKGVDSGEIRLYDVNGIQLKSYKVDSSFDHLQLSTEELPSGTYLYTLQIDTGEIISKKMVVVK